MQIINRERMEISSAYPQCSCFSTSKKLHSTSRPLSAVPFPAVPQNNVTFPAITKPPWRHMLLSVVALAQKDVRGNNDQCIDIIPSTSNEANGGALNGKASKGSGTTARGRRLLKVREEKRKRNYENLHNYPAWAKVLEDACKNDSELRAVLGDSIGNPELMRKRVEERVRRKGKDFQKSKTGSVLAFKLANSSIEYDPLYDADKGFKVMPSSFHDISDVEFQDNWGRVWVDLGTADFFCIDVLLNCLTVLSSEYLGIQQVVFGGRRMGDWEDGMTSPEFGYKSFKI
ncbi:hypothetical protein PHJA_001704500 [Phtheirospermum japonicum]|uniref:Uncharacterized protein n=1 Tax=Phtheirospermum japonicum TaxID=374723 RepID=A0A830CBE8_9LAMI|nr:hypothetical protein PHJA_001704500 [Phtheirospermum japonicum]